MGALYLLYYMPLYCWFGAWSVEENLRLLDEMQNGSKEGGCINLLFLIPPVSLPRHATVCGSSWTCLPPAHHTIPPNLHPPPSNLLAGLRNCMRIKLDMTAANKALRDPVCFRCNPTHHWRTKDKYKVGVWVFVRFILRILYLNVNEAEDRTALHIHPLPAHQGYVQGR